jgi:hypothetical protein
VRKRAKVVRIRKSEVEGSFVFDEAWLGEIMIWPQATRYKVAAGWIDLEPGSNHRRFPPPAPFADPDLALSFARLGARGEPSPKGIEKWVSKYGLLFRQDEGLPGSRILEDGRVNQKPMEVYKFTREVFRFRDLLDLYSEIRERDFRAVTKRSREPHSAVDKELAAYVLPGLAQDDLPPARLDRALEVLPNLSLSSVLALADRFLADQLSKSLDGVRLRVVPGFKIPHGASQEDQRSLKESLWNTPSTSYRLGFSWHCPDLISAIYLQLFLLATKNTPMRFCKACQTPFPAKPRHKLFCNDTCRSNARHQR